MPLSYSRLPSMSLADVNLSMKWPKNAEHFLSRSSEVIVGGCEKP